MMVSGQNIERWAERFLNDDLDRKEKEELDQALSADQQLAASWKEAVALLKLLDEQQEHKAIKEKVKAVRENQTTINTKGKNQVLSFLRFGKYWRIASVAAALVLVSSLVTLLAVKDKTGASGTQYLLLRREIETIKHSQSQLMDSLKGKDSDVVDAMVKDGPVFGGTGFALSNNGFVATNYHVVKGASIIYVQTIDGKEKKAYVFAFEPSSDVAILKIEDPNFQFGKGSLPYTFNGKVSALGQSVFSIGYPQEDLVYNEGYISCENGFNGDSASYQLEMVANPGQSGAPVLDKKGNVIALITGKQSNTPGKTYAIHADALLQLINTLPSETRIKLSSKNKLQGLNRVQQVDALRGYVCAIRVN